ncbi:MAG: hypothetical protein DMG18_08880 [Acidobacteria bacterium]|nr:MAG: hypothetical protein DMG18_08880 [Acidobacteriota bacterium]
MPERQRLLELALKGLQADRAKLDDEIADIKREINQRYLTTVSRGNQATGPAPPMKKRRMSAAARKKISEAMKRRYAELRKAAR